MWGTEDIEKLMVSPFCQGNVCDKGILQDGVNKAKLQPNDFCGLKLSLLAKYE